MTRWAERTVADLQADGVLLVEDGNHGEYRPRPNEFAQRGVAYIRGADMTTGVVDFRSASKINDVALNRIRKGIGKDEDVLLSHKGTVGKVAFVPVGSPEFVCSPQTTFWRSLDRSAIAPGFLRYYLQSPAFRTLLASRSAESDMAPYVSLTEQRKFVVPLPPIEEQRRIAATLEALDDKIESNRRGQSLIERLVQAHFHAAFSVEEDPTGEPISSLITVNPRRTLARGQLATYVGMSSLPEHAAEVMDWGVKEFGSGQKFVNGDVLMARITPCLENGKTALVDMLHDGEVGWGSTEYIVLTPRNEVSTPWIYCLVRSESVRGYAIRSMTGTSGRQRFQADAFDKYRVSAPSQQALQAFNAEAVPLFARMTALRDENRSLAKLRDTLLPEMLSGRIRAPGADEAIECTA